MLWHILAPRAVACDYLHLRASVQLWHVSAFLCNGEFLGISCYMKKSAGSHLPADQNIQSIKVDYLRVILAPSASSFVLMSLASSLDAPCLRTFGAPSTTSLASLRPRPVTSRTTLITLTLFGPTSVSSTSNSVFSSSAAAPAPAAATTTPAAADTPNSSSQAFTNSFYSNTDNSLIASINSAVVNFAIIIYLHNNLYFTFFSQLLYSIYAAFDGITRCVFPPAGPG